jgi:hypothetical protein
MRRERWRGDVCFLEGSINRAVAARNSGIQATSTILFRLSSAENQVTGHFEERFKYMRAVLKLEVSVNPNESGLAKAFLRAELRINRTTRRMSNFTLPAGFI